MGLTPTEIFFILSSGYVVASTFLFCLPKFSKKSKHVFANQLFNQAIEGKKMLKISHRGSCRYTTENTMQAFRKIFHISDCLEMDVCETADGVLVVHHDRTLSNTCGVDKLVSQVKFADLPKYKDQIKLDFVASKYFKTNNERIPTLQAVFQTFQGVPMDIQLKTPTESAIKKFTQLIYQYDRQDITIIGIRSRENDQLAQKYLQHAKTRTKDTKHELLGFMNDRTIYKLYLSYVFGLLPFMKISSVTLQIPIYSKEFEEWCLERARLNNQSQLKTKIGCRMIKLMNFMSKPLIWHLRHRGILTFGWVCNTQQSFERAAWMGVQGIMSDQPYLLEEFVKKWQKIGDKEL